MIGDIVIAVVDQEYTVKYLDKGDTGYFLKPANKDYENIYPSNEMHIFGTVVGSFRRY